MSDTRNRASRESKNTEELPLLTRTLCSVVFTSLAAFAVAQTPTLQQSQRPNARTPIDTVMYDYWTWAYGLDLSTLAHAKNVRNADDAEKLLGQNKLEISVNDVSMGLVSDIASRSWTDFEDSPQKGSMILLANVTPDDQQNDLATITVKWAPEEQVRDMAKRNVTMEQAIAGMNPGGPPPAFTRYVAYTINLSFQGKSLRYKALSLFVNGDPAPLVVDEFLVATQHYSNKPLAFLPLSLLPHGWQDNPVLHDWVQDHIVNSGLCKAEGELCCVHGRCGVTKDEFQRQIETRPAAAQPAAENKYRYIMRPPGYFARATFNLRPHLFLQEGGGGGTCNSPDDPEYCVCNEGTPNGTCYTNPAPYPQPPAQCMVEGSYREILIPLPGGQYTHTGKYHTWVNSGVKLSGHIQYETYDAGPTAGGLWCGLSGGTSCGYLNDYAYPGPNSPILIGDGINGGPHFTNTGWSLGNPNGGDDPICDGVVNIQNLDGISWNENSISYSALSGPNSNTFVHWLYYWSYLTYKDPPATISVPGWSPQGWF
jgi:hypothetical protein